MELGDKIRSELGDGVIVALLQENRSTIDIDISEWSYLEFGIIVKYKEFGIVHYEKGPLPLTLVERG